MAVLTLPLDAYLYGRALRACQLSFVHKGLLSACHPRREIWAEADNGF